MFCVTHAASLRSTLCVHRLYCPPLLHQKRCCCFYVKMEQLNSCVLVCPPSWRRGWGMKGDSSRKQSILFMPRHAFPFSLRLIYPLFPFCSLHLTKWLYPSFPIWCFALFSPFRPHSPFPSVLIQTEDNAQWGCISFPLWINQSICMHLV